MDDAAADWRALLDRGVQTMRWWWGEIVHRYESLGQEQKVALKGLAIVGAAGGFAALGREELAKVRVYISFDYDHDQDCKNLLVGQAKNADTPFAIADWSIKVASPGWKEEARKRIRSVDQVIVICGEHTNTATGVNEEIRIARDEGKPYFLLDGRPNGTSRKPTAAKTTDKIYKWTWPNLKKLIAGGR